MTSESLEKQAPVGATVSPFVALKSRNYQLWFLGYSVTLIGTWMQSVAQSWLVYEISASEWALGNIQFVSTLPSLLLMVPAGCLADVFPKRKMLFIAQSAMMVLAFAQAFQAFRGHVTFWEVAWIALLLGIAKSFDLPVRQAMAVEMVEEKSHLPSAIALNSTMFNIARVIGPSIAGLMLATVGASWCFFFNGVGFLGVLIALMMMKMPKEERKVTTEPLLEQMRSGLHYISESVTIRTMVLLVAVTHLFGFSYSTLLPAYAKDFLRTDEAGLGVLNAAVGIGALLGSIGVALLHDYRRKGFLLTIGSFLFPAMVALMAITRSVPLASVTLGLMGMGFVIQNTTINALIQTNVPDHLRGRVMAVYALTFFGTTPFEALIAGGLGQRFGAAPALGMVGLASLAFVVYVFLKVPQVHRLET